MTGSARAAAGGEQAVLMDWDGVLGSFAAHEANSPLWQMVELGGDGSEAPGGASEGDGGNIGEGGGGGADEGRTAERGIAILGNTVPDHDRGKVLLFGEREWEDYALEAEIRVLRGYLTNPRQTYPGIVVRAQDPGNCECFFFRPHAAAEVAAAHVAIAHGLQPVWAEEYFRQKFGECAVPFDDWFRVRVEVRGRDARLLVNGAEVMHRLLTYYLWSGRPGLYAGTCTDAVFRNVRVERV